MILLQSNLACSWKERIKGYCVEANQDNVQRMSKKSCAFEHEPYTIWNKRDEMHVTLEPSIFLYLLNSKQLNHYYHK